MHKNIRGALNKVQDFVADPRVTKTSRIVTGALDVAAKVAAARAKGPLAVVGAAVATLDVIQRVLEVQPVDPIVEWKNANAKAFQSRVSSLFALLSDVGALPLLHVEPVAVHEKSGAKMLAVIAPDGKRLTCIRYAAGTFDPYYWIEPGFDMAVICDAIWKGVGETTVKLVGGVGRSGTEMRLEGLPDDESPYIGKNDPQEFLREVDSYHARGISRCHLLEGPPGTGKTSFVRVVVKIGGKRLLVIPHQLLSSSNRSGAEEMIRILRPDFVLFDDVDRLQPGYLAEIMNTLDDLRRTMPNICFISTINQVNKTNAGVLRPGRLGARRKFLSPDAEEKIDLLKLYMPKYGVDPGAYNLEKLVEMMDHRRFSHDYVRFVAEEAVMADTQEKLLQKIEDLHEVLVISEYMEPDASKLIAEIVSPAVAPPTEADL